MSYCCKLLLKHNKMGNKQTVSTAPSIEDTARNIVDYFKMCDIKNCIKIKTIFDLVRLLDRGNIDFHGGNILIEVKLHHCEVYYMLNKHNDNYVLFYVNLDMIIKNVIHLLQKPNINQNTDECITRETKNKNYKLYDISTKMCDGLRDKIANITLAAIADQKNKEKCIQDKINEIENKLIALGYYTNKNLYDKCTRIKTNGTVVEYTKYIDSHMLDTEVFDILINREQIKNKLQNSDSSKIIQRLEILLWCLDYKPQYINQYVEVLPSAPYIECTEDLTIPVASAVGITQTYDNVCIAVARPLEK